MQQLAATFLKLTIDSFDIYVVVSQSNEGVIDQIRRFSSDFIRGVIFAGHHDFGSLFANLLKDLVVPPSQELAGIGVGIGMVTAIADHAKDLGDGVSGGWGFAAVDLVEAAALSGVASDVADLFDGDQKRVAVAVVAQSLDLLGVARSLPLVPESRSRSTPKPGLPRLKGFLQGLRIHPGHHQYGAIEVVLDNGGDEVLVVVLDLVDR